MGTASISGVVAQQLGRLRHWRGWSQQALADAIAQQGGALARGALAKIETGKRAVSLDELFLLAAALKVPPPMLLLPFEGDELVQVTPRLGAHPHDVIEWFFGDEALVGARSGPVERRAWLEGAEPLRLNRELRFLFNRTIEAHGSLAEAEYLQDANRIKEARYLYLAALRDLHAHLISMARSGVRQRPIHAEWVDDMRQIGLDVDTFDVLGEDEG